MNGTPDLERFLGAARLAPYLTYAEGDTQRAADLYHWNTEFAGALHSQLCHAEVLVRNAMDRVLADWNEGNGYPREWSLHRSAAPTLYTLTGRALAKARERATGNATKRAKDHERHGVEPTHDDVIAQLTFGNWSTLLGYTAPVPKRDVAVLWRDALCDAFPHARGDESGRRFVGTRMERLRNLRNRVSHHENLLSVNPEHRLQDMMAVLAAIGPEYPAWAMARSRVRAVKKSDPRRRWNDQARTASTTT
ncbi:Abi family protein [Gordonia terrae]